VGCIGEPNHPKVEEQIDKVLQASRKLKIPIGIVATNSRDINRRTQQGFTFFLAGTDAAMMIQGAVGALNGVCFK
jgi:2-keto-3-deoxy-L-rhamnonate aldolase RhmA